MSRLNFDIPAVLTAAGILVLSLIPKSEVDGFSTPDTVNHLLAYGVLTAFSLLERHHMSGRIWAVAAVIGFGLLIELVQPLFGRSTELRDVMANLAGVGIGLLVAYALRQFIRRPMN